MLIDLLKKKMLVLDLPLAEWLPMKGLAEATPAQWVNEELSAFCAQAIQAQLAAGVDLTVSGWCRPVNHSPASDPGRF